MMRKATVIGSLALLVIVTALFAAPALSNRSRQQVTIKSLARQVRALRGQVNALKGKVAAAQATAAAAQSTANTAQSTANIAQSTANTAQSTAGKLDGCLSRALPVTRYGDFVGSDAGTIFNGYDPDVLGYVPYVVAVPSFSFTAALDVTSIGDSPSYYLAIVEPSCAGGFHMAQREQAVPR